MIFTEDQWKFVCGMTKHEIEKVSETMFDKFLEHYSVAGMMKNKQEWNAVLIKLRESKENLFALVHCAEILMAKMAQDADNEAKN